MGLGSPMKMTLWPLTNNHRCHGVGNVWNIHMDAQNVFWWGVTHPMAQESPSADVGGVPHPMKHWKTNAKNKKCSEIGLHVSYRAENLHAEIFFKGIWVLDRSRHWFIITSPFWPLFRGEYSHPNKRSPIHNFRVGTTAPWPGKTPTWWEGLEEWDRVRRGGSVFLQKCMKFKIHYKFTSWPVPQA